MPVLRIACREIDVRQTPRPAEGADASGALRLRRRTGVDRAHRQRPGAQVAGDRITNGKRGKRGSGRLHRINRRALCRLIRRCTTEQDQNQPAGGGSHRSRTGRNTGQPDYLPALQRDLVAVISKYVKIDPSHLKVNVERQDNLEVLEVKIELPEVAR